MHAGAISPQAALIHLMVVLAAADGDMTDEELARIGEIIRHRPVFHGFDEDRLVPTAQDCAAILQEDQGLETVLGLAKNALPSGLEETAYAIACEVAIADRILSQEEMRVLELMRYALDVDRLVAAGIERGVRALSLSLPRGIA